VHVIPHLTKKQNESKSSLLLKLLQSLSQ